MSTLLKPDEEGLAEAGRRLRAGNLVAFPTGVCFAPRVKRACLTLPMCNAETVYGLGANALDESAVLKIFEYKGRPLTGMVAVLRLRAGRLADT